MQLQAAQLLFQRLVQFLALILSYIILTYTTGVQKPVALVRHCE